MGLGGFFKKVKKATRSITRTAANPGAAIIRQATGRQFMADGDAPMNARNVLDGAGVLIPHPAQAPGAAPNTPPPNFSGQSAWQAPTKTREQMVAEAIARSSGQRPMMQGAAMASAMNAAPAPAIGAQTPAQSGFAPGPQMQMPGATPPPPDGFRIPARRLAGAMIR
jgi:hypothetical protein